MSGASLGAGLWLNSKVGEDDDEARNHPRRQTSGLRVRSESR